MIGFGVGSVIVSDSLLAVKQIVLVLISDLLPGSCWSRWSSLPLERAWSPQWGMFSNCGTEVTCPDLNLTMHHADVRNETTRAESKARLIYLLRMGLYNTISTTGRKTGSFGWSRKQDRERQTVVLVTEECWKPAQVARTLYWRLWFRSSGAILPCPDW